MKTLPVSPVDQGTESEVREMLRSGSDLNQVLSLMRTRGMNKIVSMKLLRDHAGISLREAKRVVELSPTWADRRESDDRLHDSVTFAVEHEQDGSAGPRSIREQEKRPA